MFGLPTDIILQYVCCHWIAPKRLVKFWWIFLQYVNGNIIVVMNQRNIVVMKKKEDISYISSINFYKFPNISTSFTQSSQFLFLQPFPPPAPPSAPPALHLFSLFVRDRIIHFQFAVQEQKLDQTDILYWSVTSERDEHKNAHAPCFTREWDGGALVEGSPFFRCCVQTTWIK